MFKVTYFNPLSGKRHDLIDRLDRETAEKVLATYSDPKSPAIVLSDVRIESQEVSEA